MKNKLSDYAAALGRVGGCKNTPAQQAARKKNAIKAGGSKPRPESIRQQYMRLMDAIKAQYMDRKITSSNNRVITIHKINAGEQMKIRKMVSVLNCNASFEENTDRIKITILSIKNDKI